MTDRDPALPGRSSVLQAARPTLRRPGDDRLHRCARLPLGALTAALAQQPGLRCRVVYDERAAGYIALGLAQQSGRPVGLVCTSGTAAVNLAPAVVEAFYQGVPLLVLTADRPPEWIDQQDNQAIRQRGLYEPHVRASYELPVDLSHPDARWHALRILQRGHRARQQPPARPGPRQRAAARAAVSRAGAVGHSAAAKRSARDRPEQRNCRAHRRAAREAAVDAASLGQAAARPGAGYTQTDRGRHAPGRRDAAPGAAQPEPAAGRGRDRRHHRQPVPRRHAAAPRRCDPGHETAKRRCARLQPDLVISFGGPVTSKYVKQFVRSYPPQAHWRVQPAGDAPDTYQTLTHVLPMQPGDFFGELAQRASDLPASPGYAAAWQRLEAVSRARRSRTSWRPPALANSRPRSASCRPCRPAAACRWATACPSATRT